MIWPSDQYKNPASLAALCFVAIFTRASPRTASNSSTTVFDFSTSRDMNSTGLRNRVSRGSKYNAYKNKESSDANVSAFFSLFYHKQWQIFSPSVSNLHRMELIHFREAVMHSIRFAVKWTEFYEKKGQSCGFSNSCMYSSSSSSSKFSIYSFKYRRI